MEVEACSGYYICTKCGMACETQDSTLLKRTCSNDAGHESEAETTSD